MISFFLHTRVCVCARKRKIALGKKVFVTTSFFFRQTEQQQQPTPLHPLITRYMTAPLPEKKSNPTSATDVSHSAGISKKTTKKKKKSHNHADNMIVSVNEVLKKNMPDATFRGVCKPIINAAIVGVIQSVLAQSGRMLDVRGTQTLNFNTLKLSSESVFQGTPLGAGAEYAINYGDITKKIYKSHCLPPLERKKAEKK